jgi:hypothetical protein
MKKRKTPTQGRQEAPKALSNQELITLAVYLLGGESHYVDTEDIAIKANNLAPGRFTWLKYPEQINIHTIKTHLWDCKSERKGSLLLGSDKEGWMLSANGRALAKLKLSALNGAKPQKKRLSSADQQWLRSERIRMLGSEACRKLETDGIEGVSAQDAEAFFRLNDYVLGKARERKIVRILNAFGDDRQLGAIVRAFADKVQNR